MVYQTLCVDNCDAVKQNKFELGKYQIVFILCIKSNAILCLITSQFFTVLLICLQSS